MSYETTTSNKVIKHQKSTFDEIMYHAKKTVVIQYVCLLKISQYRYMGGHMTTTHSYAAGRYLTKGHQRVIV